MGHTRGGSTIREEVDQEEKFEGRDRRERKGQQQENSYRRPLGPPRGKRTGTEPLPIPIQGQRRLARGAHE
ncbi:hypothetical protein NDU88_003410 [Pleurodeles waltl]|uniref:Uncharacterized protein n=1 Tax=Pleurodeles waltl TaxID=8319 RepID=A0AAV7W6U1_PLEWA|nr:hypothetical protein NDU88_003410 [Pleurodeles waltl]